MTAPREVEVMTIPERAGLDTITVFWQNFQPGKGRVVLECWGCAWASYFGAMGGVAIQEFFAAADTSYLVTKMGVTAWLKQTKKHELYLGRLIDAVKKELAAEGYTTKAGT